jgi:hypothetical protein
MLHAATAVAFAIGAGFAVTAAPRLEGTARRFALVFGVALALAGVEKVVRLIDRIHEGLHRLGFGDPPYLNGIDDLILLCGFAAAGLFLAWHWRVLAADRRLAGWFTAAAGLAAMSFAIDAFGPDGGRLTVFEECLELAMAACLGGAALRLHRRGARGVDASNRRAFTPQAR